VTVPEFERDLIVRLLTTMLREDVAGLRTRGRPYRGSDGGAWLALRRARIPVRRADPDRGDLATDWAARAPFVVRVDPGRRMTAVRLIGVLNVLTSELLPGLDPGLAAEFATGLAALRREAVAALGAAELRHRRRPVVLGRLRPEVSDPAGAGWSAAVGFESLAAHRDHPLYPFSVARVGLPVRHLLWSAPEHRPDFRLRWLVLPSSVVEQQGRLPDWWPQRERAGEVALPVHPALPPSEVEQALAELGLGSDRRRLRPEPARPTLSMRTVALIRHPDVHLKLPLAMRTLGRLNLRAITRPGLADGVLVGRVLQQVIAREPRFADTVRIADESTWLHGGHPLLAVLVRRWDAGLADTVIVPVAGLAGRGPTGRPVFAELADRFDADLDRLLVQYLRLLLDWQLTLWLRYGVGLEAHPQNVLIAVDRTADGPRIRLLVRDLDSAKLDLGLLGRALGSIAPTFAELNDERLAARDPRELIDLFVTTTLHQAVAAVLVDLARALDRPVRPWLALIRPLIVETAEKYSDSEHFAGLKTIVLDADRLPVKRALTAATLLPKTRTGAADVNKFYGADAPSYL